MRDFMFSFVLFHGMLCYCPTNTINGFCSCFSTRYEAVNIVCEGASSINSVAEAISKFPMIDSLTISNTIVETLPGYVFQGHRIKKLVLRNNGLRFFHQNSFTGDLETILEELEIRSNYIDAIPQLGVASLKKLKILSLPENLIEYVEDNSFLSYHSRRTLEKLDLSSNNITAISPTSLLGLENLKQLLLDNNLLSTVPTEALENVQTLEYLGLGVNKIKEVDSVLSLLNLKSLSLEVNQIRELKPELFSMTPQLLYLYLGSNLLTSLDPWIFNNVRKLRVLSLSNNKGITSFPLNAFQFVTNINRLEFSDCSINQIDPSTFQNLKTVQVIILSRNQLTRISQHTFSSLPMLTFVDLSSNIITSIENFSFSQSIHLTTLDLSNNRLETLPGNVFHDSFSQIKPKVEKKLFLHNNPWKCDNSLNWFREWLSKNSDITTSGGPHMAKCWAPFHLSGFHLKEIDPREKQNFKETETNTTRLLEKNESDLHSRHKDVDGIILLGFTLGVFTAVFAICVLLGFVMRKLLFTNGEPPSEFLKERKYGSRNSPANLHTANSYHCNSTYLSQEAARCFSANNNIYLNKPRYW